VPIVTDVVSSNPTQLLATGQWFSSGSPISPTNNTDCHDITELLVKVALNTIKSNQDNDMKMCIMYNIMT